MIETREEIFMKKIWIPILMASVLAVTSFSGCGNKNSTSSNDASEATQTQGTTDTTSGGTSELVMSWWGNQTRNERTQAALDLYTEKNPNVTFDGQFAEWDDYWKKLATSSAGHTLPDIIQMDYKYLDQYVSNGLLLDLSPYIADGTLDLSGLDVGIVEAGSQDGGVYAICNGVNAPALLYNKTLLDENGITIKDNMTLAEFEDVCREVYEKTGYKTNVAYGSGDNYIEYLMRGIGYPLFKDGLLGVSKAEDFEPFFDIYEVGIKEGWHLEPSVFAERTIGSVEQDPAVYGSSPETMSWCALFYSNQLTALQGAAPEGMEIGMTTWPSVDPAKSNYLKPSQFFCVTVDSKNPEEAVKVLNYLTNDIDCNNILLGERGVPASSVVADAISPKLDEDSQRVISYINEVVTPNSSTLNPPAPDGAGQVYELIDQLEEKIGYGQMTSKEAAAELYEKATAMLAQ